MNMKNYLVDKAETSQHQIVDGICGGCGQNENVTNSCCVECAKVYLELTPEESKEALEYYNRWIKPLAKITDEDHKPSFPLRKEQKSVIDYITKSK